LTALDKLIEEVNHVLILFVKDAHDELQVLSPPVNENAHQPDHDDQRQA
jgi:hypothetical protein